MLEYSRLCKHRGVRGGGGGRKTGRRQRADSRKKKARKAAVQGNKSTRLLARPEFLVARLQIFALVVRMPDSVHGMYVRAHVCIYTDKRGSVQRHIGNLARVDFSDRSYGSMQSSQQPHTIPPLILLLVRECNPSSPCESSPPPALSLSLFESQWV